MIGIGNALLSPRNIESYNNNNYYSPNGTTTMRAWIHNVQLDQRGGTLNCDSMNRLWLVYAILLVIMDGIFNEQSINI